MSKGDRSADAVPAGVARHDGVAFMTSSRIYAASGLAWTLGSIVGAEEAEDARVEESRSRRPCDTPHRTAPWVTRG